MKSVEKKCSLDNNVYIDCENESCNFFLIYIQFTQAWTSFIRHLVDLHAVSSRKCYVIQGAQVKSFVLTQFNIIKMFTVPASQIIATSM